MKQFHASVHFIIEAASVQEANDIYREVTTRVRAPVSTARVKPESVFVEDLEEELLEENLQ